MDEVAVIDQKRMLEMEKLRGLQTKMQRKEEEKLQLLHKEYLSEEQLFFKGGKHILTLEELEQRYEFNARQREKALTRLY